jgi:hypothetical protein
MEPGGCGRQVVRPTAAARPVSEAPAGGAPEKQVGCDEFANRIPNVSRACAGFFMSGTGTRSCFPPVPVLFSRLLSPVFFRRFHRLCGPVGAFRFTMSNSVAKRAEVHAETHFVQGGNGIQPAAIHRLDSDPVVYCQADLLMTVETASVLALIVPARPRRQP